MKKIFVFQETRANTGEVQPEPAGFVFAKDLKEALTKASSYFSYCDEPVAQRNIALVVGRNQNRYLVPEERDEVPEGVKELTWTNALVR